MKKCIFLDRDGTINIEKDYLYKVEDFEFEDRVVEALKILKKLGYIFIVITNQSGIARGYYTEEDFLKLDKFMKNSLKKDNIEILETYYCPHHEKGFGIYKKKCTCRKPGIDFFEEARKKYDIDYFNSFMLGDKISDLESALKLGIKPVLIETGHGKKDKEKIYFKSLIFKNLYDFAKSINI